MINGNNFKSWQRIDKMTVLKLKILYFVLMARFLTIKIYKLRITSHYD